MKMNFKFASIVLCLITALFLNFTGYAYASPTYYGNTGDSNFDGILININTESSPNMAGFISGINQNYNVPEMTIKNWLFNMNLAPADVYLIAGIAKILNMPVDIVFNKYQVNKAKGWGYIAKQLGIKPGSKEFHMLKNGGVAVLENTKNKNKAAKSNMPKKSEKQDRGDKGKKQKNK